MTTTTEAEKFDLIAAPLHIGRVRLAVRDLSRVSEFYQDVLGLVATDVAPDRAALGTRSDTLLELIHKPDLAPRDPRGAGLFHTAFLLPQRSDLGRWLAHVRDRGIRLQGASDHLVSEAIYLEDPEGNGIEVYADKPVTGWRTSDGEIAMATEPLNAQGVLQAGSGGQWNGVPDGTIVGHVHLQVGDTAAAEEFWQGVLGFDLTSRYPGASFFGSGGYHHQVAGNVWRSRGAGAVQDGTAGLAGFELRAHDRSVLDRIADRAEAAGRLISRTADTVVMKDPWNIEIELTA